MGKNLGRADATAPQQREATALLQHLFRFGATRRTDARGRAILHQEANFTVVDDDEVLTTLPRTSPAAHTAIESFPGLTADNLNLYPSLGGGGAVAAGRSVAWGP